MSDSGGWVNPLNPQQSTSIWFTQRSPAQTCALFCQFLAFSERPPDFPSSTRTDIWGTQWESNLLTMKSKPSFWPLHDMKHQSSYLLTAKSGESTKTPH